MKESINLNETVVSDSVNPNDLINVLKTRQLTQQEELEVIIIKRKIETAFNKLKFDEETHTYKVGSKFYKSVTTSIKDFYKPFKANEMATIMSNNYNKKNPNGIKRTKLHYIKEWSDKNNKATTKGSNTHYYSEQYPLLSKPSNISEQGILDWYMSLPDNYVVLCLELRMYSDVLNKAGTADMILYNLDTKSIVIADWKTNSTNLFQVYSNKKMLEPFNDMVDNSYNHYCIQLSLYKLMLTLEVPDIIVEDLWLMWLYDKDYTVLDETKDPKKYKLHYIDSMINTDTFKQFRCMCLVDKLKEYNLNSKTTKLDKKDIETKTTKLVKSSNLTKLINDSNKSKTNSKSNSKTNSKTKKTKNKDLQNLTNLIDKLKNKSNT